MNQKKFVTLLLGLSLFLSSVIGSYAQSSEGVNQSFRLFLPLVSSSDEAGMQETAASDEAFIEPEFNADASVISAATTTMTLLPTRYATTSGADGGQPVGALAVLDSPNTQNDADWLKYLEMYTPGSAKYIGYRSYTLPAGIDPATITALQVKANYQGPVKATQSWTWTIYHWSTKKWVKLGDNTGAPSWQWKFFTFNAGGTLRNYVNSSTREIQIRLQSNNSADDMDLDYEALFITTGSGPTPTPTRTPTPITVTPTRTPTATPTRPATTWWKPAPGTSWQIQLQGTVDTSFNVQVYVIDLFDVPTATISQLKQQGRKVVCYFSAGSWENWRPDASAFPAAVLGNQLDGWPGERWLDVRNLTALGPIMAARMDLAVSKGCNGVDPDNVDGFDNNSGFPLTAQDQLTYNRWLAQQAHARGLAIGLKNDLAQIPQLVNDFDWALNEQCFQYNECETLLPFINAGKPVFGIEYSGNEAVFCPRANGWNFDTLKKRLDLMAWRLACRDLGTAPTATPTVTATPRPSPPLGILIPFYNYPTTWDAATYLWDDVAAANSRAPITAIINPNNGPGGGPPNADYATAMTALRNAGVKMLGYVATNYGNRDSNLVKAEIDLYATHFNINGIFLDEAASGIDKVSYYATLYSYIKSKPGLTLVILNPGTTMAESYLTQPAGDTAVIFENGSGWPGYVPDAYVRNYPANRFAMLAYNVADATTMRSYIDLAKARNIGYVYITNDGGDNPWDTLPSYWTALVEYVAQP